MRKDAMASALRIGGLNALAAVVAEELRVFPVHGKARHGPAVMAGGRGDGEALSCAAEPAEATAIAGDRMQRIAARPCKRSPAEVISQAQRS